MKISPISSYAYSCPSFKSSSRKSPDSNPKINGIGVYNSTWFFRDDINWNWLVSYMEHNFADKSKVNVYNLACSDGSEAYTLAICLNENMNSIKRNKFLPINASDIDKVMIRYAKRGRINLYQADIQEIYDNTSKGDYFESPSFPVEIGGEQDIRSFSSYQPNAYLRYAVNFEDADILTKLSELKDDGDSVILCRNVTPYLTAEYLGKVADALNKKLKKGSLLVLGDFDRNSNIREMIKDNFEDVYENNIYRKI